MLGSPSIRAKLSSSGRTVTPLNVSLDEAALPRNAPQDEAAMELSIACKQRQGFNKQFQQMLSHGKGASVFEALKQQRLTEGANALPLADQSLLTAKDSDGFTILHYAARCNQAEAVNLLLDSGGVGVDIDRVENMGFTALHVAVRYVANTSIVLIIILLNLVT